MIGDNKRAESNWIIGTGQDIGHHKGKCHRSNRSKMTIDYEADEAVKGGFVAQAEVVGEIVDVVVVVVVVEEFVVEVDAVGGVIVE